MNVVQPDLPGLEEVSLPAAKSALASHKLPTNLTTRNHAIHRWMNFTAGYSPEFVASCLERDGVTRGLILDPFAGMGTTLVVANSLGLDAVGYEPHPHAAMMCRAKTMSRSLESVDRIESVLRTLRPVSSLEEVWSESQLAFLSKLIDESQLQLLTAARLREVEFAESDAPLYRLVVTRLLEHASGSSTDGIYKAPTTKKRSRSVAETYPGILQRIREDISLTSHQWGQTEVVEEPAQELSAVKSDSVSHVITSPPYLNNFDFAEMTRMELYFWNYASSWGEITERVRKKLLVNTTTAPIGFRKEQEQWMAQLSHEVRQECSIYVDALANERSERARSKDYDRLVYPYFAQMQGVIRESFRTLMPGSSLDLVVSDAALYGVHIHTEQVLRTIMLESGFDDVEIVRLRSRGDRWVLSKRTGSKDPLGEFQMIARKA